MILYRDRWNGRAMVESLLPVHIEEAGASVTMGNARPSDSTQCGTPDIDPMFDGG